MNTLKVYLAAVLIALALLAVCLNLSNKAPANTLENSSVRTPLTVSGMYLSGSNNELYTSKFASFKYAEFY